MRRVFLLIFLFIILQGFYAGITSSPKELDSVMYHIPIAKSYLTGDIFSSPKSPILHRFFPGASEGILALFILFHVPLNLYNVLGVLCLFFASYFLGKRAGLSKDMIVIFAVSFSSLTTVTRWMNVQIVDIWMAVFYSIALAFLIKPEKNILYFLTLGIAVGMILGTKYSGPLFVTILFLFFGKNILRFFSFQKAFLFLIPVSILGLFWYLRNFIVMGNPLYPISFLSFPGVKDWALEIPVWRAILNYPASFATAVLSEYLGWSLLIIPAILYAGYELFTKRKLSFSVMLLFLALCNLLIYLLLPNGASYRVHVSNLRYSYPALLPLLLSIFLIAKDHKWDEHLGIFALANILFVLQFPYHPKLLIIYIPLALFIWMRRYDTM
ncbi:hypothetical protein HZC27_02455 [Candidatus Roizmanbacteria bacterium]|nr:hypothetical protein [Candidatus Roizmanbacteria bacterium]